MKKILKYFLQGLLFVIPVGITLFIIYTAISWIDSLIPKLFDVELYPGAGLVFVLVIITTIGYLGSTLIAKPAFIILEAAIYKLPLINLIYSSVKDFIGAFVGEKKRFNQPVLVKINKDFDIYRVGFLTQADLKNLDLTDMVAVYFPHSYNISGNLTLVPKDHIIILNAPSSEVMKFIVSGGVSGLNY
ncbi:MAG: DUF502 domain-containing protein [Cytophagaceae bacterium]